MKNIHWKTFPTYESLLQKIPWESIISHSHCIKESPTRQVLEFSFQESEFILKIFKSPNLWDKIRLFFFSRPKKEWENILFCYKNQLPVPEPIAYAKTKDNAYILTKKIQDVQNMRDSDCTQFSLPQRRKLIHNLAKMMADLHATHCIHQDLHSGNILFDSQMNIYLVDLYKLRHCIRKKPFIYLKNLGMIGASLANSWKYSQDFLLFLQYYQQHWKILQNYHISKLYSIVKTSLKNYKWFFANKTVHRCLKHGKYYQKFQIQGGHGIVNRKLIPFDVTKDNIQNYLDSARTLKQSKSRRILATKFGVYKEFYKKKKINWILDCFRYSYAKKAWIAGASCLARSIPTAAPILFWEKRHFRILFSSYLLMEEIKNAQTLEDFFYSEQDKEKIHKILYQAGKLIRFMHEQNLCHRDLKSQNFMVTKQYKLLLIDLDGLRVKKYISIKRRKKNLARLMRSVLLVKHMGEKEQKILQQGYQSLFYNAYIT